MADTNTTRQKRKVTQVYQSDADKELLAEAERASGEKAQEIARRGIRRESKRVIAEAAKEKSKPMDYNQLDRFQRIFDRQIDCDDTAERDRAVEALGADGYLDEAERQAPEPWPPGFREWASKQLAQ